MWGRPRKPRGRSQGTAVIRCSTSAKTQDQVETGGANEQAILQQRLNQLSQEMAAAAKRGDKEGYDKAFSKSEGILNEAANATDANGNLKYFGQVSAINELYDHQLVQLKQIEAVNQRNAQILAGQKASLQSDLKEAEDAGKAIFQFDVKKKDGSDRFNSVEELDAAGAKALARFDAAAAKVNANPAAGGDLRGSNAILARGALQQRINDAHNQFVGAPANLPRSADQSPGPQAARDQRSVDRTGRTRGDQGDQRYG